MVYRAHNWSEYESHQQDAYLDETFGRLDPETKIHLASDLSFRTGLSRTQIAILNSLFAGLGAATLLQPNLMIWLVSYFLSGLFFCFVIWRGFLIVVGLSARQQTRSTPPNQSANLPVYSILVPLYQEAEIMAQLAGALRALNWPQDRLDIQLLIEADDIETLLAARKMRFPPRTRISIVPSHGPRTKPNALNYGLGRAEGSYLTIYDAEDLPHPDQLREAYNAFETCSPHTVCLQAPLIADNPDENWLSAHWALEYDVQFGLLMPGLTRLQMPVLLGGTSNHFRRDALFALGGWDAWNVTEDADLGLRIARAGLRCAVMSMPTYEDAPADLGVWVAQRSRWVKGFIQTWLVLMRSPAITARELGLRRFVAAHLSLGTAILAPLLFAPCMIIVLLALASNTLAIGPIGTTLLIAALVVGLMGDLCAPGRWHLRRVVAMLTRTLYWPLHFLAALRAIWELAKDPFFWAKTPHKPRHSESDLSCSTGLSASVSPPAS